MPLIVNADDFGKTSQINKAVCECFEKGLINRTTVMVNMPYAKEAYEISKEHGFSDRVGLHINLTQGKPLTERISKNPYFCDENGEFNAAFYHNRLMRLHMDSESVSQIEEEIKAQIEKYHELGFGLNHLDSHHHSHTNYPVLKAVRRLSKTYSFSSIRLSRNLYKGGNPLNRIYKKFYNHAVSRCTKNVTDYFGSYTDVMNYFSEAGNFSEQRFLDFVSKYSIEIMVHPDYDEDGGLMDTGVGKMGTLLHDVK